MMMMMMISGDGLMDPTGGLGLWGWSNPAPHSLIGTIQYDDDGDGDGDDDDDDDGDFSHQMASL